MPKKSGSKTASAADEKFAEAELKKLAKDSLVWARWIKKTKREKINQDRLLVFGNYHILTVKAGKLGKRAVQRCGHIFDLDQVTFIPDNKPLPRAILKFKDFTIEANHVDIIEVVNLIRDKLNELTAEWPEGVEICNFRFPKDGLEPITKPDLEIAGNVLVAYTAWCKYYKMRVSSDLETHIFDTVDIHHSHHLDLSECPGIELKTGYSFGLPPLFDALRYNPYFKAITIRDVPRKEAISLLAKALRYNRCLTKVVMSGLDAVDGFELFDAAMKKNPANQVCEIDFSRNKMGDKGVLGIGRGISTLQHGISLLNFSDNSITGKGLKDFLHNFSANAHASFTIEEFDFSHNNLGKEGSVAIGEWLRSMDDKGNLAYLNLSHCQIDVSVVVDALQEGALGALRRLDLSGNRMDKSATQGLRLLLGQASEDLEELTLQNCKLTAETMEAIGLGIAANESIKSLKLDVSGNEFGPSGAERVARGLVGCGTLHTLLLNGCGFRDEGLVGLLNRLGENASIQCLDIGCNIPKGQVTKATKALATFLRNHDSIQTLVVSGDGKGMYWGPSLVRLVAALTDVPQLTELDISGNKIGDKEARNLCDGLRTNTSLRYLAWDSNDIGIGGFSAFRSCVTNSNRTLCRVPVPVADIRLAVGTSKTSGRVQEKVDKIMGDVRAALQSNEEASAGGWTPSQMVLGPKNLDRPIPTEPPMYADAEVKKSKSKKKKKKGEEGRKSSSTSLSLEESSSQLGKDVAAGPLSPRKKKAQYAAPAVAYQEESNPVALPQSMSTPMNAQVAKPPSFVPLGHSTSAEISKPPKFNTVALTPPPAFTAPPPITSPPITSPPTTSSNTTEEVVVDQSHHHEEETASVDTPEINSTPAPSSMDDEPGDAPPPPVPRDLAPLDSLTGASTSPHSTPRGEEEDAATPATPSGGGGYSQYADDDSDEEFDFG